MYALLVLQALTGVVKSSTTKLVFALVATVWPSLIAFGTLTGKKSTNDYFCGVDSVIDPYHLV